MRSYRQFCGLAKALDLVGERWTLLIVRNLLLGPLRYSELQHGLPGITTNLLAKRLKEMAEHSIIEKVHLSPSQSYAAYRLTPLGCELEPAIHALGRWGSHWLADGASEDERRFEWLLVSLGRRYRGEVDLTAEVVADEVSYRFTLMHDNVEIHRGIAPNPTLRLQGTAEALAPFFLHGLSAEGLPDEVQLAGSIEDLRRLLDAFAPARFSLVESDG